VQGRGRGKMSTNPPENLMTLLKQVNEVDQEKLETYMRMFDRMAVYVLTANLMPPPARRKAMKMWDSMVKTSIDTDAKNRTNFLEASPLGRGAKLRGEPDGEMIRLESLKAWKLAHDLIALKIGDPDDDGDDFSSFNEFEVSD